MDYQCECGEEFDIYAEDIGRRDWELDDSGDNVLAYFTVKCPKCGKPIRLAEYFTYDRTVFLQG